MKKNIYLFMDSLGPGGAQRQFVGLARLLKEYGYMVMVATYYDYPFYKSLLDEGEIPYECYHVNSKFSFFKLVNGIRRFKADVLISFQTDPNSIACIAAKICGVKLIVSERNTHQCITMKDQIIFNLYRFADYVVPNSYSEEAFIRKEFPFLKNKTVTITNFVDLQKFCPRQNRKMNERLVIMTVASIKASKNTKKYLNACIKAIKQGCNVDIVWYGVNDRETDLSEYVKYTEECFAIVKESGLGERIRLLPKRIDIDKAYREADVFCLPSMFEGTPNVICEAMASGLPVMASRVCDNSNFVIPKRNGWLFDQTNVDDIVAVLMEVTNVSKEQLYKYGVESRKIVENKCSELTFVEKYINLIESI